jgi:hypothetical protein
VWWSSRKGRGVNGWTVGAVEAGSASRVPRQRAGTGRGRNVSFVAGGQRLIPKGPDSGKLRRRGIPTTANRVVPAALKLVLEPIFEANFQPVPYRFWPNQRAHDAIAEIQLFGTHGYQWVLNADVEACLDRMSTSRALLDRVRARVKDKRVVALVKALVKAGLLTDALRRHERRTQQPVLEQLGDPLGVLDVGLPPRDGLHVRGVEQPHVHDLLQPVETAPSSTWRSTPSPRSSSRRRPASRASPAATRPCLERPRLTAPAQPTRGAHAGGQRCLADVQPGHPLVEHLYQRSLSSASFRRRPEGHLTGDRPTCSQQQSSAPKDPAPYNAQGPRAIQLSGLHAPLCRDVAGRRPQCPRSSHPPTQQSRSQRITPGASRVRTIRGDRFVNVTPDVRAHGQQGQQ